MNELDLQWRFVLNFIKEDAMTKSGFGRIAIMATCVAILAGCPSAGGGGSGSGGLLPQPAADGSSTSGGADGGSGVADSASASGNDASTTCPTGGLDDCPSTGAKKCNANGQVVTCGDDLFNPGCLSWGNAKACAAGTTCKAAECVKQVCTPYCDGKDCGASDSCGGTCGCTSGLVCAAGKCKLPCKAADDHCIGVQLNYCGPDGVMLQKTCSDSSCMASGYVGLEECGTNPGDSAACLCKPCSAADNGCAGGVAAVCNTVTGKMSQTTCKATEVCNAGKCLPTCTSHASCGPTEVCTGIPKLCSTAYGKSYLVTISAVTLPQYDGSSAWDALGGLPDPKVCVTVDAESVGCTTTVSDSLTASWETPIELKLFVTEKFGLKVYDVDAFSDDLADIAEWPDWIKLVKAGTTSSTLDTGVVKVTFTIAVK